MRKQSSEYRVLLLSDTHGQLHPAIRQLAATASHVVHAGDIGHPEILQVLAETGAQLVAVRGNNDTAAKWSPSAHPTLDGLPHDARLALPGGQLAVEHGHHANPVARRHARLRLRHPDARLVIYGHSHRQLIDREDEPWVVNPGAAGRSRTHGGSACIVLTITGDDWQLRPYQFSLSDWNT